MPGGRRRHVLRARRDAQYRQRLGGSPTRGRTSAGAKACSSEQYEQEHRTEPRHPDTDALCRTSC